MRIFYRLFCFIWYKPFREEMFKGVVFKYVIWLHKPIVFRNLVYLPYSFYSTKSDVCEVNASKFIREAKFISNFSSKLKVKSK